MNRILMFLAASVASAPAHATSGLTCRTAGAAPIAVTLGLGNVAGSPLISTRLSDNGYAVPVRSAQWWLDQREMRLLLTDPQAMRQEAVIKARRDGSVYDGSLTRNGRTRWVRCRES